MVHFVSDSHEMEKHLRKIHDLVCANGSFVHEDIVICSQNGSLTIEAPARVVEQQKLMMLPDEALLPLEKFELVLNGDDICIESNTDFVSPVQVQLMEEMLALYNLNGKIAEHKRSATHSLYHLDRELLAHVADEKLIASMAQWNDKNFYIEAFMASRRLGRKLKGDPTKKQSVLMPLIDFFNHHPQAYSFGDDDGRLMTRMFTTPETGRECFVRYGKLDDHHVFLSYGYPETKSPMVESHSMEIDVPGFGTIQIHKRPAAPHNLKNIPRQQKGLEPFLSPIAINEDRTRLTIGCVWIPPKGAPRALRRVLGMYFERMKSGMSFGQMSAFVDEAEHQIIDNNCKYYSELKGKLENHIAKPGAEQILENAKIMVDSQLRKITAYSFDAARS